MKSIFFSLLIITSTVYCASEADAEQKTNLVAWWEPDILSLAVTYSQWSAKDLPGKKAGLVVMYTKTPVSYIRHDQVVARSFLRYFLQEYLPVASAGSDFSESELVTICRRAIARVNTSLLFDLNSEHLVREYILAAKVENATLLTRVEADDSYDKVLPKLPKDLENLPWVKDQQVCIEEPNYCIKIGSEPYCPSREYTGHEVNILK